MDYIEILGVITGLLSVWFAVKQNVWTWIIGIINIVAFLILFIKHQLYPDALLHFIYLLLSIYGIIKWKTNKTYLKVSTLDPNHILGYIAILVLWIPIGFLFSSYTNSAYPYRDSIVLVYSIFACILLARKKIESWEIYIASNVIAITVYCSKGLYLTAGLYLVYIILCIKGYKDWKKELEP